MGGVVTFELIAIHESCTRTGSGEELGQLAGIVLAIAIGVKDPLFRGRGKTAAQGCAITAIVRVSYGAQERPMLLFEMLEHLGGLIAAAIIDYDDLVVGHVLFQDRKRSAQQLRQRRGVVVSRKKHA